MTTISDIQVPAAILIMDAVDNRVEVCVFIGVDGLSNVPEVPSQFLVCWKSF